MSELQLIERVKGKVEQGNFNQEEVDILLDSMSQKAMSPEEYVTPLPRFDT